MLKIKLIGNVKMEKDCQDLSQRLAGKAIDLVGLLFMHENQSINKGKIIDYLWPDSSEEAGKANLRYNIWEIKNTLGEDENQEDFLLSTRQSCSINPKYSYICDFLEVYRVDKEKEISINKWEQAESFFQGDFLEGFYFKECDELNTMILFERRKLEDQRIKVLFHLLDYYASSSNKEASLEILRELERVGPYDEVVAHKILSHYENMGRRSQGILFYQNFRNRLSTYFGIQPSQELKETFQRIKEAEEDLEERQSNQGKSRFQVASSNEEIVVETSCIGEIKYYWISDFLEKMQDHPILKKPVEEIKNEKKDLHFFDIDRDISSMERPPDMRLAKSFLYLVDKIARDYSLCVRIHNFDKMDGFSQMLCKEIQATMPIRIEKS